MACVFVTENFWSRSGTLLVTENFWSWSDSQLCNLCGVIWTILAYCECCCNHRCATEISFGQCYSRTQVTRTLKGNEKQFELARNSNYWDKFQCDLDQGKKWFELAGNSSHLCSSNQGSTTVLPQAVSYMLKQCIQWWRKYVVELIYCSTLSLSFITKVLPSYVQSMFVSCT